MVQLLILGEACRQHSFIRGFFKVPIQRRSGYMEGVADISNTGLRVLQKRPGHPDFPGIHFGWAATVSSSRSSGPEPGLSPLADGWRGQLSGKPLSVLLAYRAAKDFLPDEAGYSRCGETRDRRFSEASRTGPYCNTPNFR
jgi:hypothetical protein